MKKRMAILMSMAIAANMIASVPVCAADIFTDSMTTDSAITQEADDDSFSDGLGTPDFAVYPLQKLLEAGHKVVAVVTNPDKPAGRGQKIQESPSHCQ